LLLPEAKKYTMSPRMGSADRPFVADMPEDSTRKRRRTEDAASTQEDQSESGRNPPPHSASKSLSYPFSPEH